MPAPPNGQNSPFAVDNGLLGSETAGSIPPVPAPPSPAEIDSFSSQISDSSQIESEVDFDPASFDPASLVIDDGEEDSVLMKFLKSGE